MGKNNHIVKIPWDSDTLNIDSYEILSCTEENLRQAQDFPGHFTIKVDPLLKTDLLHNHGFYYCGTLVKPFCLSSHFNYFEHRDASVSSCPSFDEIAAIIPNSFLHGRFHRDFNISNESADLRYKRWAKQLYDEGSLIRLLFKKRLAGFFGCSANRIVLHAVSEEFRGKKLSKYLWSAVCKKLFQEGYAEIVSSISTTNIPAINLYTSLGFRFREPLDVYHKLSRAKQPAT